MMNEDPRITEIRKKLAPAAYTSEQQEAYEREMKAKQRKERAAVLGPLFGLCLFGLVATHLEKAKAFWLWFNLLFHDQHKAFEMLLDFFK